MMIVYAVHKHFVPLPLETIQMNVLLSGTSFPFLIPNAVSSLAKMSEKCGFKSVCMTFVWDACLTCNAGVRETRCFFDSWYTGKLTKDTIGCRGIPG